MRTVIELDSRQDTVVVQLWDHPRRLASDGETYETRQDVPMQEQRRFTLPRWSIAHVLNTMLTAGDTANEGGPQTTLAREVVQVSPTAWFGHIGMTRYMHALQLPSVARTLSLLSAHPSRPQVVTTTLNAVLPVRWWLLIRDLRTHALSHSKLWVAKPDQLGQVAVWPYGNVYEHGKVCWGQNALNNPLIDAAGLDDLFFSTPFNSDLRVLSMPSNEDLSAHLLTATSGFVPIDAAMTAGVGYPRWRT